MSARSVLFLCTGNYYRSRFAEELFNHLAGDAGLQWRADSRGLAPDFEIYGNPGPMSVHTVAALQRLGIDPAGGRRMPLHAADEDFRRFDRVIALSHDEHRPMMAEFFPVHLDAIDYWGVEDLHLWTADQAIPAIESAVRTLVDELARALNR